MPRKLCYAKFRTYLVTLTFSPSLLKKDEKDRKCEKPLRLVEGVLARKDAEKKGKYFWNFLEPSFLPLGVGETFSLLRKFFFQ